MDAKSLDTSNLNPHNWKRVRTRRNLVHAMYVVIPVEIRVVMVGVRKAIGTLDLGVGMRPKILTGVLGVMSLEIKIPTWTRKAIGTLETVETWLPIQKVAIGIWI